jgi:hypothetical protein
MDNQPVLVVEHPYRCRETSDELRLALYRLRRPHNDWFEVRVTMLEHGRELGVEYSVTLATVEQARPVWREQARRLWGLGYRRAG